MSTFGQKLGRDIHTTFNKLGRDARVFGMKLSDHPFRKINNTLHSVNGVLNGVSSVVPVLKPISLVSNGLEAATSGMRGITFADGNSSRHHKPMLER